MKRYTFDIIEIYKFLICLSPLFFAFFIIYTNNIDFNGAFESGNYIEMANNWLGESNTDVPLKRLPLYPLFISLVFKLFGSNNFHALLFAQSIIGFLTFYYLIKILEILKIDKNIVILTTLILNLSILFRFSVFLPNCLFIFIMTLLIYNFTNFYFKKKIRYFLYTCFCVFLLMLTRANFALSIFITIPLICFFILQQDFKKVLKLKLIFLIILSYFSAIGVQYFRYYSKIQNVAYTTQSGLHLILWTLPCLSNKYGCGSRDLSTRKVLYDEYNQIINNSEIELDEVEKNKIAKKVGINYIINDMDKKEALISTFYSFSKLFLHSSLTEIYPSIGIDVINPSIQKGKSFFEKIKSFLFFTTKDLKYFLWLLAMLLVFISRLFQIYAIFIYFKPNVIRLYFFILASMIFITTIPSIGIGNPRYRSDSETLFLMIGALGISNFFKRIKRK